MLGLEGAVTDKTDRAPEPELRFTDEQNDLLSHRLKEWRVTHANTAHAIESLIADRSTLLAALAERTEAVRVADADAEIGIEMVPQFVASPLNGKAFCRTCGQTFEAHRVVTQCPPSGRPGEGKRTRRGC